MGKTKKVMVHKDWCAEAARRFGPDPNQWKFVCPSCGHIASIQDWRDVGASEGEFAFSCVGRHLAGASHAFESGKGPCNYAGGGLFRLNPVTVQMPDGRTMDCFNFAPEEASQAVGEQIIEPLPIERVS